MAVWVKVHDRGLWLRPGLYASSVTEAHAAIVALSKWILSLPFTHLHVRQRSMFLSTLYYSWCGASDLAYIPKVLVEAWSILMRITVQRTASVTTLYVLKSTNIWPTCQFSRWCKLCICFSVSGESHWCKFLTIQHIYQILLQSTTEAFYAVCFSEAPMNFHYFGVMTRFLLVC